MDDREFVVAESARRGAERTAFNEMFRWVRSNARKEKIAAILAHKLDRVCRNMRDAVRLQELEDDCGVQLIFVENQFGPGAAGALSFHVMAAVAEYYSSNLRAEVLKGIDEKVRQGWPTGLAPFGYVNVDDRNEPVQPHPVESNAVIRIFELYSSGQHTLQSLAAKLSDEGHVYGRSRQRFNRTTLSYVIRNRFYIGELTRNGQTYDGKYQLLIDRRSFEACQEILDGKNRRTGNPEIMLSGGVVRCGVCGYAIVGEQIRRRLRDGSRNVHTYYRCGNNHKSEDHPPLRWREADLEQAIVDDLDSLRIPDLRIQSWLRNAITEMIEDSTKAVTERRRLLSKRRTELSNMKDRLLNVYLAGSLDEKAFSGKSADLKAQQEELGRQLDETGAMTDDTGRLALSVFDFSQNLTDIWRGSNYPTRRDILECVSLNRTLDDVTLYVTKRKPFDILAETANLKRTRGDWI